MAISFKKYIDITSGVGGGAGIRRKDMILRLFTLNELVPPETLIEMTTAEDVGAYFGTTSEEYARAKFYFSFVSKQITSPKKIGFCRYVNVDVAPRIFGGTTQKDVGIFKAISSGYLTLTINGIDLVVGFDFTNVTSLTEVAQIMTTFINESDDLQFKTAQVVFDPIRQSFDFQGGVAENATITASGDLTTALEWDYRGIFSNGKTAETITSCLDASKDASSNFATFNFMFQLPLDLIVEAGEWAKLQNIEHLFLTQTTNNDAQSYYDALKNIGGVDVIISNIQGEYPELLPACITASTDYGRVNAVQNFMFYQADLTPSITTTTESNRLDDLRVNYYGETQTAGQKIAFYQRGNLMGLPVDPLAENVFVNEIWFKDAMGSELMSLFLNLATVGWNAKGRGQILNVIQSVVDEALFNGVISTEKPLNNTQKVYITELTNDDEAWRDVQSKGYWVDVNLRSEVTTSGITEYFADYILIYAKADAIRKVVGSHIMI